MTSCDGAGRPGSGAPPLLPPAFRPATRWAALVCLGLVVVLALANELPAVTSADHRLNVWVASSTSVLRGVLRPVADLSGPAVIVLCSLVLAALCGVLQRASAAGLALAAPAAAAALSDLVLKPLVGRPAAAGGYAYPSGHATAATAVAAVLVVLALPGGTLAPRISPWGLRGLWALAGLATCYVGVALVALGYHSTTDVVGGAALGCGTVCGLALLLDRVVAHVD